MIKHYFPVQISHLKEMRMLAKRYPKKGFEDISSQHTNAFRNELFYHIDLQYLPKVDRFAIWLSSEESPPRQFIYPTSRLSELREKVDEFVIQQAYKWKLHKRMSKGK